MRKTAKFVAAVAKAKALNLKLKSEHDAPYKGLEAAGWYWDSDNQAWEEGKPQTSMFAGDDEDTPSGVIRLRVMAHPGDIDAAVSGAKTAKGMRCIETSDKYPNRRGVGMRVYLTFVLDSEVKS